MRKLSLIFLIVLLILVWGWPAKAQEENKEPADIKLISIGDVTLLSSYSKVCGGNNISGIYASANFAPVLRASPRDYYIPLYSGLYRKQRQIINEEEGGRLYTTLMSHNFSLRHKHIYPNLLTQRFTGFVSLNYNKETSNESFGDGLYDYRDHGLSFDYQFNTSEIDPDAGTIVLGGKYYFREYPNFKSLISLATQTAAEENEKDQHAWGPTFRYIRKFGAKLLLSLSYDFLFKHFTDKLTIDSDGVLIDGKNRKDKVHYFSLNGDYGLGNSLILGLDGEIELNNSNQNYYDTMDTPLALGDDVFVPHYFNYNRYEIKPSLTYRFPLAGEKNILLKLAYAYTLRDYPNRNVKNSAGTYKSDTQEDRIHAGFLNISFPLTRKLSFLINADYMHNISNMKYEKYYRYDYDIYHILSGFSYKF